ncbi:microtubule-associated protein 10 [Solea senegalensis]|uniref:Microtubule-associated protein 10 n=1 Tax=Solea senegalensis TaxID=28829 RepID=A0AAV6S5W5_SOLSE|nr:microtubule-associated protein 10 [Solea senegalensis]KAG7512040.1 microtubule-associated protein 10 [Solea senegalensis]
MSGGKNVETLFSFELLVENIRVEKDTNVSDQLALAVRLLDFPTLLIYSPQQHASDDIIQAGQHGQHIRGEYVFYRGKSCFFLMNLSSLHTHLSNTPLYVMVLDVKEEIPKLIGSSLISMANVMDRIMQDVAEHGVSVPSSHGEKRHVSMCSLTGENIGFISLSYKLISLGTNLLPHTADGKTIGNTGVHGGQHVQESTEEKNISRESLPLSHLSTRNKAPASSKTRRSDDQQEDAAVFVATERSLRAQTSQTLPENEKEEDLNIFCPPQLYYSKFAEEKHMNTKGDNKQLILDSEVFTIEDSCSEDELMVGLSVPKLDHRVRYDTKPPRNQEKSEESPSGLGETLQQLPLLNALLVELSHLNGQNPQQPLPIHPNLAWIYRSASTEPPHLRNSHSPKENSTSTVKPTTVQKKDKQVEGLQSSSKSTRKKLVFGSTKTFNMRLKQISPHKVQRECIELIQNNKQTSVAKVKSKPQDKLVKSSQKKFSNLNENVETMMQNIKVDSITRRQRSLQGKYHDGQERDSERILEKPSPAERRDLTCIHIPSVDSDSTAQNKEKSEHQSESNQSPPESGRHRGEFESLGSSTQSSRKSSFSDSSEKGNEEEDYADDFNSLSDAYSPDPVSSPDPSRVNTPKSPVCSDSCNPDSASLHKRAVFPVPLKTSSSPQRSLRATHIIRPRTCASLLSFSSDAGDRDESASLQTICSRKQVMESSGVERSGVADSFLSRSQRSESKTSSPVRGFSTGSVSSLEQQEAEEMKDELGSLDIRKEYQHISELVARKLPGYTL